MSKHAELIAEARSYADAEMNLHDESAVVGEKLEDKHASNASLFAELADALEAAEAETDAAKTVRQIGEIAASTAMSPHQAMSVLGIYGRIASAQAERDEALAIIAGVKESRSNHPACDVHKDDDPISCGWKRAVVGIDRALDEKNR